MAVPMPPGFIDIPTAKSMRGFTVNVIGIVIDTLTPTKSRGSSFVSTFTLKTSEFAGSYQDGLKVKYFNNDKQNLPTPQVGDVVILHSLKVGMLLMYTRCTPANMVGYVA